MYKYYAEYTDNEKIFVLSVDFFLSLNIVGLIEEISFKSDAFNLTSTVYLQWLFSRIHGVYHTVI